MRLVGIILVTVLLAGCSASPMQPTKTTYLPDGSTVVEQDPLSMSEDKRNLAIVKCQEARKAEAEAEKAKAAAAAIPPQCPPGMSEVACMAIQFGHSQAQTMNTVLAFAGEVTGKPEPTCAEQVGKGLFDFKTVEVQEKNRTARHYGDAAAGGIKSFMLGLFGIKAVEHAGDETELQVNGDENSPSVAGRTVIEKTGTTVGEDSPIALGEDGAAAQTPVIPGITPVETVETAN